MEIILILIFFGVMFFKHFGAVVRDNSRDNYFRNNAQQHKEVYYFSHDGARYVKNNHKIRNDFDKYLGEIITDLDTGKKWYKGIDDLYDKYHEWIKHGCKPAYQEKEGLWEGKLGEIKVYIDRKTDELYYLACADPGCDIGNNKSDKLSGKTWFFVDITRKKIMRRTPYQIKSDQESGQFYSDSELMNYKDIHAGSVSWNYNRETNGQWVPKHTPYFVYSK